MKSLQDLLSVLCVFFCRHVYLSYLDSVHFFRPKQLRTQVYHELLIAYQDYVAKRGFVAVNLWAYPPDKNQDYIFNCHPPGQRILTQERLIEWYKTMLESAVARKAVIKFRVSALNQLIFAGHLISLIPPLGANWPKLTAGQSLSSRQMMHNPPMAAREGNNY